MPVRTKSPNRVASSERKRECKDKTKEEEEKNTEAKAPAPLYKTTKRGTLSASESQMSRAFG